MKLGSTNKPNLEELLLLVKTAIQILNLELGSTGISQ